MANLEGLKKHIAKAKTKLEEEVKKAEDPKNNPAVREKRKKVKRLSRKVGKIIYFEKKAAEKKKSRKEVKAASEG